MQAASSACGCQAARASSGSPTGTHIHLGSAAAQTCPGDHVAPRQGDFEQINDFPPGLGAAGGVGDRRTTIYRNLGTTSTGQRGPGASPERRLLSKVRAFELFRTDNPQPFSGAATTPEQPMFSRAKRMLASFYLRHAEAAFRGLWCRQV